MTGSSYANASVARSLTPSENGKGSPQGGNSQGAPSYSAIERLRRRDFAAMDAMEKRDAQLLLQRELVDMAKLRTRRFRRASGGVRIDARRTQQLMLRSHGELLQIAKTCPRREPPGLVLMCDISASMRDYSRMFLIFAHAMTARYRNVHCFVFGTRLTNVTRRMQSRRVDDALDGVANDVLDWEGGTRIAASLRHFNRQWTRRVLARPAVFVLLSDGLERDTGPDLSLEARRLSRSCRQLLWLNPLLRFDSFEPRAFGIRTLLSHVDRFIPAHNVDSLLGLADAINADGRAAPKGRVA